MSGMGAVAACGPVGAPKVVQSQSTRAAASHSAAGGSTGARGSGTTTSGGGDGSRTGATVVRLGHPGSAPLPGPASLRQFPGTRLYAGAGVWQPIGRRVDGHPAVYRTSLTPPGAVGPAAIAWMDTNLLSARLYSGSLSPGGGPYKYTAPIAPAAASSLVAAFNGGFKMHDAHGGYYTEHRMVIPLVRGAASLVIYANGSATIGAWGSDVTMTPSVVAVRQNLTLLVSGGRTTARAATRNWRLWGGTCPCGVGKRSSEEQWRSGLGITASGALVYVIGGHLKPLQVAQLLVRAGAVRGMQLDINPTWPVFASFAPTTPGGQATAYNGTSLTTSYRGAATFFDPTYARDFITMSARPGPGSGR